MLNRCYRFFSGMGCPLELVTAMEVVVEAARAAVTAAAVILAIASVVALIAALILLAKAIAAAIAEEEAAVTAAVALVVALLTLISSASRSPPRIRHRRDHTQAATLMQLKALFFDAFAARPRPQGARILRPPVNREGDRLRGLLAGKTSLELTPYDIRTEVESRLWMLAPEAFLYFLPAFLHATLAAYPSLSVFASELVGALTEPAREDVVEALDRFAQGPPDVGLPRDTTDLLRRQQLEWFDSGTPQAIFHERFDKLSPTEGAAVLTFLAALKEAHGEDYPFDELDVAIHRYWAAYRAS